MNQKECSRQISLPNNFFRQGMELLGRWSYSLYLIHVPIGVHLVGHLRSEWILANPLRHVAFDLANVAICVAFSALFHRWVEAPSHLFAKRLGSSGFSFVSPRAPSLPQA